MEERKGLAQHSSPSFASWHGWSVQRDTTDRDRLRRIKADDTIGERRFAGARGPGNPRMLPGLMIRSRSRTLPPELDEHDAAS
jgi:hypothetical protein